MTDDTLWEEYDKSLKAIDDIKKGKKVIDDKVNVGNVNTDIFKTLEKMQDMLEKAEAYKSLLDAEIAVRIAKKGVQGSLRLV